jgi:hypothetical protein
MRPRPTTSDERRRPSTAGVRLQKHERPGGTVANGVRLNQRDRLARLFDQMRGRYSRDPATDHRDLDLAITRQRAIGDGYILEPEGAIETDRRRSLAEVS